MRSGVAALAVTLSLESTRLTGRPREYAVDRCDVDVGGHLLRARLWHAPHGSNAGAGAPEVSNVDALYLLMPSIAWGSPSEAHARLRVRKRGIRFTHL